MNKILSRKKYRQDKLNKDILEYETKSYYDEYKIIYNENLNKDSKLKIKIVFKNKRFFLYDNKEHNPKLYSYGIKLNDELSYGIEEVYYLNQIGYISLIKDNENDSFSLKNESLTYENDDILNYLEDNYELKRCIVYSYLRKAGKIIEPINYDKYIQELNDVKENVSNIKPYYILYKDMDSYRKKEIEGVLFVNNDFNLSINKMKSVNDAFHVIVKSIYKYTPNEYESYIAYTDLKNVTIIRMNQFNFNT